jgi:Family of unknown function (DUF5691)
MVCGNGAPYEYTTMSAPQNAPLYLSQLLPAALVGTERQAVPDVQTLGVMDQIGDVGQMCSEIAAASPLPAVRLLRWVGALSVCASAGVRTHPSEKTVMASEPDVLPTLSDARLFWTLANGPLRLKCEVLTTMSTLGLRLPVRLLPLALEEGRRATALRAPLLEVLGERGRWLATQNSSWQFAAGVGSVAAGAVGGALGAGSDDARWIEGSIEQRCAFLREEWQRNPLSARTKLTEGLADVPARERVELLTVSRDYLTSDDEPMIESILRDRGQEVRQIALGILLRLATTAHAKRAASRLEPLLKMERALIRKRWVIEAPSVVSEGWVSDAIETARPQHERLGERAWWLYQLVRQVPLTWWTQHTALSPAELLKWAHETDWAEALIRGWRDVLFAAPESSWCKALLEDWPAKILYDNPASVLALLPRADREIYWQRELQSQASSLHSLSVLVGSMIAGCAQGEVISLALSKDVVTQLLGLAQAGTLQNDYNLRNSLLDLCCVLHPQSLVAMRAFPRAAEETPSVTELLHSLQQIIETRLGFLQLTHSPESRT